jgi:hypothetical protein
MKLLLRMSVHATKKAALLSEVHRMEDDLAKLRAQVQALQTIETRTSLTDEGDRVAASQATVWAWLRWFRAATDWCDLHSLSPADAFDRWDRYHTAASQVWGLFWEQWYVDLQHRLPNVRDEADRRILDHLWRDWSEISTEAARFGWLATPPTGWGNLEGAIRRDWHPLAPPERLLDLF